MGRLPGLPPMGQFVSIMLDANKAQSIRAAFEASAGTDKPIPLNYVDAVEDVQPMLPLNHSTVAVLVADINKIRPQKTSGKVSFKIASSSLEEYNVEEDDFLENDEKEWRQLDLTPLGQSYIFSELAVELNPKVQKTLTFTKGHGQQDLMVIMPSNRSLSKSVTLDEQLAILKPSFQN
jgi:hypothetical protein